MSHRPLVSVVTIFLDAERFLEEAIESVFAQTFQDWELLLVDDGSQDQSSAIAQRYASEFPERVRYLEHPRHENRGMSASRNLGIRHARGGYVALLDADDVWLPAKLEQQLVILETEPEAAMVYGRTQWWYGWTGHPEDVQRDFVHDLGVPADTLVAPPTLLTGLLLDEGISPCTCSMLVRRDVLERVGGFEESFRGLYEDQALCAKITLEAPVFASGECWYRYRQHHDSACSVAERTGQRQAARSQFLDWLEAYLSAKGAGDTDLWQALRSERRRNQDSLVGRGRRRLAAWVSRGQPSAQSDMKGDSR